MLLCVWWPTHPQRAGCWVVSADIPLPEPPWSGGEARQPAGRLLSRCALPSRSATADHSGGGGTSWTRLPGRFPHQRRKSPWTELGGEHTGMFCWRSGQTECESVFFFLLLAAVILFWCNVIQCCWEKVDDLKRFMSRFAWQLVNISWCWSKTQRLKIFRETDCFLI